MQFITNANTESERFTQYYDMLFPDDEEKGKPAFKLLQMAHAWRAAQAAKEQQEAPQDEDQDEE